MKYRLIDTEKKAYPIAQLCKVMQVSRSGCYVWQNRKPSKRQQENAALLPLVINASRRSKNTYGTRRMAHEVSSHGTPCGRSRAKTLMNLAGVVAKQKRKYKVTTDSGHNLSTAPNLLNRKFNVYEPDRVYVSDITYIWTREGWLYLSVVIDLFSR
ncbi:MAG: IS3 family transposase, partial [Desulfobacula sp.]|nr:IS3 family transposase [Desulfobacula sp.]